ncbi:hypothetical protein LSH36_879g00014 [Paralvinella palmiformis]|uniref:Tetratricopeptide repeat protein 28 n=1 Tax=Paralvinella palmiformis TaxID=53620 RepID=A0AAD9IZC0_9ANNE|nr:hypothetical protein LSH36_879g00014 [Paralvinella palmiformis]
MILRSPGILRLPVIETDGKQLETKHGHQTESCTGSGESGARATRKAVIISEHNQRRRGEKKVHHIVEKLLSTTGDLVAADELDQPPKPETIYSYSRLLNFYQLSVVERQLTQQVIRLKDLGDFYIKKAVEGSTLHGLLEAANLYNAALNRCEGTEQRRTLSICLRDVELLILGQNERKKPRDAQTTIPKRYPAESARRHREAIQKTRDFVAKQVLRIQMLWATLIPNPDKSVTRRQECEVKKECMALKKKIRIDLKNVVADIAKECVDALGAPPCLFALVALGDLAVEECTPYTDLEFLLLIDEESTKILEYFQRFGVYLQFKVLNLGETPLSSGGVKVMDDIYFPAMNAVFDPYSKSGIKIEVGYGISKIMDWCNIKEMDDDNHSTIPIRKAQDVLRPLTQLMLSDGGPIIFSILQGSVVYGDPELLQQVKHDIGVEFLRSPERRQQLCRVLVENSLILFETQTRFHFNQFELDLSVIRRELESSHYLVQVLHVLYGLHSAVPARIVEELHSHLLLPESGEHDLKMALGIAHMLRCALQASAKGQHTANGLLVPSKYNANKLGYQCHHDVFTFRRCSLLSRVYSAVLPLVAHYEVALGASTVNGLNDIDFMLQDLHTQLHTHIRCQQPTEAAAVLRQLVKELRQNELTSTSSVDAFEAYIQLGVLALECHDIAAARRHFISALNTRETAKDGYDSLLRYIECWLHYGLVSLLEDDFKRAESYFRESSALFDQLRAKQATDPSLLNDACSLQVSVNECLSTLYYRMGSVGRSVDHVQIAIDFLDKSDFQPEHWKMLLLRSAGLATLMKADFKAAHYYLKLALIECDVVSGKHMPSVYSASLTFAIGKALDGLGKPLQGRVYKTSARDQFLSVLGSPSDITFENLKSLPVGQAFMVQNALNVYAECCMGLGEYAAAVLLIEKGLLLGKSTSRTACRRLWEEATSLLNKSTCLLKIQQVESATESLQTTLEIFGVIFLKNKCNYFVLECSRLMAVALMEQRQYSDAKHELKIVITDIRHKLGEDESMLQLAKCMEDEAAIYASQNEYDNALTVWQSVLDARKQIYGSTHPLVAFAYRDIGRLHEIMCDFDSAADNLILSLTMMHRLFGDNVPSVELTEICLDLGIAYQEANRMALAENMLLKTVQLWSELEALCPGHPENIRAHLIIGNFYRRTNKVAQALTWHRKCLRICLKANCIGAKGALSELLVSVAVDHKLANMPKECILFYEAAISTYKALHPDEGSALELSDWLNEISNAYDTLGNKSKANECRTAAANIRKAILGEESENNEPESSLSLLAEQFEQRAQFHRAVPLREKALIQAQSDHGSDMHQEVVQCYRHLIDTYLKIGLYEQAQRRNNELLVLFRKKYSHNVDHADIASALRVAGYINHGLSRFEVSKRKFEEALDMYYRLGVAKHRNEVISCLTELAKCLLTIGEKERAESHLDQAKELCAASRRHRHQPCEPDVEGAMYMAMGWNCESFPNFQQAVMHYKKAQKLFHKKFGPSAQNVELALCLSALGRTQCVLGDYDAGIINLDKSVDMLQIIFGDGPLNRTEVFDAYCDLANGHLKGGDPTLALEYYTKVLHIVQQKQGTDRPCLQVAKHLGYVAYAAHKTGQYELAVKHATEAASIYNKVLKKHSTHPDTVAMLTLAGDVYMDMGQVEKALRQYKDAAHMVLLLHNGNALSKEVERAMMKVRHARLTLEANTK